MLKKKTFFLFSLLLIFSLILLPSVSAGAGGGGMASDWEQFQKDCLNSGQTESPAPIANISRGWRQQVQMDNPQAPMAGICVAPVVAGGKVFVLDACGGMWAFEAKTGAEKWRTDLSCTGNKFQLATPAYGEGKVFAATNDGHVYALNAENGSIIWDTPTGDTQLNTPVKYADGKVYVGSWTGKKYYCLEASDGKVIWERPSTTGGGYYWAGACLIEDYLLFGDMSSVLTCVYQENSQLIDEIKLKEIEPEATDIHSSISYNPSTGKVYFTDRSGYCWAFNFNQADGKLSYIWHKKIGSYSSSTPVAAGGKIYAGNGRYGGYGQLVCLNEADGSILWTFDVEGGVKSSPTVSLQDGKAYIYFTTNCEYGTAYCLDENGNLLWEFTPEEEAGTSGGYILHGVAISDGWAYFGNDGGGLYTLKTGELPAKPDLVITKVTVSEPVYVKTPTTVTAVVYNRGGTEALNFAVSFQAGEEPAVTETVYGLAAGEGKPVSFNWKPALEGEITLKLVVDPDNSVEEANEDNNERIKKVKVVPKGTVKVDVRVEGKKATVFNDQVTVCTSTIVTKEGHTYNINDPTALGALDEAAQVGGFNYVATDAWGFLFVDEIAGEATNPETWDGWMYRVDWVSPPVGAADYILDSAHKEVLWYYGSWTAKPLKLSSDKTNIKPGESITVTVEAYDDAASTWSAVYDESVHVYVYGANGDFISKFPLGDPSGKVSIDLNNTGQYILFADKGDFTRYIRSNQIKVNVSTGGGGGGPGLITVHLKVTGKNGENFCDRDIQIEAGKTVLDVLFKAKTLGLLTSVEVNYDCQWFTGAFVEGINGQVARCGEGSEGWVYDVNGVPPARCADEVYVNSGDRISWKWSGMEGPGGGSGEGTAPDAASKLTVSEVEKARQDGLKTVTKTVKEEINLEGKALRQAKELNMEIVLKLADGRVTLNIPPGAGEIAEGESVKASIAPLAEAKAGEYLAKASPSLKPVGKIYEIKTFLKQENQEKPFIWQKEVNVLFSYKGLAVESEQNLAAYVFKEDRAQWERVPSSKVDSKKKEVLFSTARFSKFILMEGAQEQEKPEAIRPAFKDLPEGHWAFEVIEFMAGHGFLSGYPDGTCRPDRPVTRAEFISLLVRVLNLPDAQGTVNFADVPPGAWYYQAVAAASSRSLVKGYPDGRFAPDEQITREQAAALLARSLPVKGASPALNEEQIAGLLKQFKDDGLISGWAREAVAIAVDKGLLKGYPDQTMRPQGLATRAEVAATLKRLYEK
ncbi:MAG: DUF4430 domain-containing protein [Deltaproteobacteria bacterium]|nr:MAG: DUF4430 domain-containing protein [Deltaproteobacteria bacterium]